MLSCVLTGNGIPHDNYNIRGIAHARTNRKDDISMQRGLYIDEAHTALNIFRFVIFFGLILKMDRKECDFENASSGNFEFSSFSGVHMDTCVPKYGLASFKC